MLNAKKLLVLFAGPPAAGAMLNQLAAAVRQEIAETVILQNQGPDTCYSRWAEVDILVPYATACSAEDLDQADRLRAIIVPSLGYDGVDLDAATSRGVVVANGRAEENFETVADVAIMFMLMALYEVRAVERRLRDGVRRQGPPVARMLRGKTIGIIGLGNIAKTVIARLAPWQVKLLVHTRSKPDPVAGVAFTDLDTLVSTSDMVLPLLPATKETRHLLGRDRLLQMKAGSTLINLSRGSVIDEEALADPAVSGRLHMIALDVFEREPLPIDSPLRALPNAILTPHEIAHTAENLGARFHLAIDNIEAVLAGRMPRTALNAENVLQFRSKHQFPS
jgi:phosphoglycerate dehydrogenase-like enzyme